MGQACRIAPYPSRQEPILAETVSTCPPHCPGRRSHWYAWTHETLSCPLGAPCCPTWNANLILVRPDESRRQKEDAA